MTEGEALTAFMARIDAGLPSAVPPIPAFVALPFIQNAGDNLSPEDIDDTGGVKLSFLPGIERAVATGVLLQPLIVTCTVFAPSNQGNTAALGYARAIRNLFAPPADINVPAPAGGSGYLTATQTRLDVIGKVGSGARAQSSATPSRRPFYVVATSVGFDNRTYY